LICFSWVCYSDWQEQITVNVVDDEEPDAMGLDVGELDVMEPNIEELDAGPEV
jgi:hypothetical protein